MGVHNSTTTTTIANDYGIQAQHVSANAVDSASSEAFGEHYRKTVLNDWIEVWDYVGGIRFRGFVAERADEKAMVVFFDQNVVGGDLKAGSVHLTEILRLLTNPQF